jgi:hypothetical protein
MAGECLAGVWRMSGGCLAGSGQTGKAGRTALQNPIVREAGVRMAPAHWRGKLLQLACLDAAVAA